MEDRHFGEIPDVPTGMTFEISGSGSDGADSIVVSGGYEDDIDAGDEIIYTGHGGNDPQTGKQIADQTLTRRIVNMNDLRRRGGPPRGPSPAPPRPDPIGSGARRTPSCPRSEAPSALIRPVRRPVGAWRSGAAGPHSAGTPGHQWQTPGA